MVDVLSIERFPSLHSSATFTHLTPNPLTGPVALGVVTVLFTFVLSGYHAFRLHRGSRHALSKMILLLLAAGNVLLLLMYGGTAALMFRDKGKDFKKALDAPPLIMWGVAEALAIAEA